MKLKRMAVVVAAAVAGPTVLMATPAMAEEKPAVIVPDAAPKDDTAPAETPTEQTPAPADAAVTPPVAETPATAPAVPPAAKSATPPVPSPALDNHEHEDADEGYVVAEGPEVSVSGLPKAGFKAGGDWQNIKFKVDNSGRAAVQDYGFGLFVADEFGKLKEKHLQLEVLDGDQWVPASTFPDAMGGGEHAGFGFAGRLFQVESVDANETFTMDLRLRFAKGAPVGAIQIIVAGGSMDEDASVESEPSFYKSKITKASTSGNNGDGASAGNGNNNPNPNGGAKPINDMTGNNAGNGGGNGTNAGGELAETGTDAATSWALGGAGVALAMGAALVAGTGKRRRPTA
ncbi:hypothetical protein [Streptomyces sp. NPDC090445]|uniref:hypothetical protein n=1 Tax=Streptomyces sp. NPDC090445 TaxID=3365963 RepID=UPI0037FED96F